MIDKAKNNNISKLIVFIFAAGLLFVSVSCEKNKDNKIAAKSFEIDKKSELGPLTAHVRVSKSKITIADTFELELEADIDPNYDVNMPKVDEILQNFGIVDWKNPSDKLDPNNNVVHTSQYRLEPFLSGNFQIPAFTFEFHDVNNPQENHKLTTEPIDIEVASLLGDQRANLQISDIAGVVDMPNQTSFLWIWILSGAIILACGTGTLIYFKRRHVKELVRIFKPAHEIAYDRLRALVRQNLIEQGKIKEFYEGISNILRHYIEHRFDLRAPERTTEEFLSEIQYSTVLSLSDKESLGEFLEHCDMVKFAKYNPTDEQIQKMFDLVKTFIEKTKSEEKKIDVTETRTEEAVEVGSA
jgi:hypothetical protein